MPLPPEHYFARADEIEAAANAASDPTIKRGYLELAIQYRDMGLRAAKIRQKAEELDLLAKNMVGNTKSVL